MSDLVIKDGRLEIIPASAVATPEPTADLAQKGFGAVTGFEIFKVPVGAAAVSGLYADLINGLARKFIPTNLVPGLDAPTQNTLTTLLTAWGTVFIANRVKAIGHQIGRDAALVLVADAARAYTAPLVNSLIGMIPAIGAPATPPANPPPTVMSQAEAIAADYYTRTRGR